MKEKQQPIKEQSGGPGLPSIFDNNKPQDLSVSVASGPYEQSLPIAGRTVAQVREQFSDMFDIDPKSQAVVNGHDVGEDVTLKAGERLMFMNRSGEKGSSNTQK